MRIRTAAAAILTIGFALAAPAAHAATAPVPQANSAACNQALATAQTAENAYNAAAADLKKQVANGGNPGTAEQDNVTSLMNQANAAASDAGRICGVTPVGTVTTGDGSTSQGADSTLVIGGASLVGAAGLGALALRRRNARGTV